MRKIIAFSFVLSLFCSVYAEKLTGFMGIKFGDPQEVVENKMKNLGYEITSSATTDNNYHCLYYGCINSPFFFLDERVQVFAFNFKNDTGLQSYSMAFLGMNEDFQKRLKKYYSDLKILDINNDLYIITLLDRENKRYLTIEFDDINELPITKLTFYNDLNAFLKL